MPDDSLPIWYLQAGLVNGTGKFEALSQGSAALVMVKKSGEPRARKMLVTAQHVLRSGKLANGDPDPRNGPFHAAIRAWPPDYGYNDDTAIEVKICQDLSPDQTKTLAEPEDLLFLELPEDVAGSLPCVLLSDADCRVGLDQLNIVGFISGKYLIDTHRGIVKAAPHPGWQFNGEDGVRAISILAPGDGSPGPGASGGGIFHGNRYAGVYRGTFGSTGQHLFLSIVRLRQWCRESNHELVDWSLPDAVNDIREGIETAATLVPGDTKLKEKLSSSSDLLFEIEKNLGLFTAYKQLHDCLHRVQMNLPGMERAAKTLNSDPEAGDQLDLALTDFQIQADSAARIIKSLPEVPPTLRLREENWLSAFNESLEQGRKAYQENQSAVARIAARDLRTYLKRQLPRINDELAACAKSMNIQRLKGLFEDVAGIEHIRARGAEMFVSGGSAAEETHQQLKALLAQHDAWQKFDTNLWSLEEELNNQLPADPDIVNAYWAIIQTGLAPLVQIEPSAKWSVDIARLQGIVALLLSSAQWEPGEREFRKFQRACRFRFYSIDEKLKEAADVVSRLAATLNNLLNQLAQ